MLIPSTHQTALLLLLVGLICLGSWANTFKFAKWRFELYYLDFALGALALAALSAFTLGMLGSELSFNDRLAVAGLRSQAFAMAAGFLFGIGNLLLVGAISLVGIAVAFPLALSLAFLIGAYFEGMGSPGLFAGGSALFLAASLFSGWAARLRSAQKQGAPAHASQGRRTRASKGIVVGVLGGVLIGSSSPLVSSSFWGDLGLGAYGGLLMFALGLTIATAGFDLMFMNIALEGGRVTFGTYLAGSFKQHVFGLAGGVIWGMGMLGISLGQSGPPSELPGASTLRLFAQGAVLLSMLWGLVAWKELAAPQKARSRIMIAFLCFGAGMVLFALRQRS